MDSVPPPSFRQRKLRPWYLVAAMSLVWVIGLYGLMSACETVDYLREGSMPDVAAVAREAKQEHSDPAEVIFRVYEAARFRALSEHQNVAFPLQVAQLLLSGLLVIASGLAMRGRKGARAFALQVLAANAILTLVDYTLTRSIRSAWIDVLVQTGDILPALPPHADSASDKLLLWWFARMRFVFKLGALAVAAVALTRTKTKAFFDAVARATEQAEEEP